MARGDQLIRQWKLLHILAARGGRTVPELMREVKCSRRTVWRDLAVLQQVGFPLTTEQDGRESRYRLIEGPKGTPPIPFNLPELMSLHMGRHLLVPLRGTPLGEAVHTALEKISATLGPAGRTFLDRLDQTMSARTVQAKDYSGGLGSLRLLQQALHDRRTVEAEYHSLGEMPSVAAAWTPFTSGTSRGESTWPRIATPAGRSSHLPSNGFGTSA